MPELGRKVLLVSSMLTLPPPFTGLKVLVMFPLSHLWQRPKSFWSLPISGLLLPLLSPPSAIYRVHHDLIEQQNDALPCSQAPCPDASRMGVFPASCACQGADLGNAGDGTEMVPGL